MAGRREVRALIVHQWLPTWEAVEFSGAKHRRRPEPYFLILSLDASEIRQLTGIQRRSDSGARALDLGIQRVHDVHRSTEISRYVQHGFPWSELSATKRRSPKFRDLVKPGWLPTAIVANILTDKDQRNGKFVNPNDRISVALQDDGTALVTLPDSRQPKWCLAGDLPPLEVIDGQHRLWAFDDKLPDLAGYQLPIVAFEGLDRSWQAYLFYTINIKPTRINSSLAFDLYPLLRTEDWLEKFDDRIYRTTRAQELTEALWSHPHSPWYQRINMLGSRGQRMVTQNSWVRSLQATIVKSWGGQRVQIGGLFGAPVGQDNLVLPWSRSQQAAFLIYAWTELAEEVLESKCDWAQLLRSTHTGSDDAAFAGSETILNSDQGVRGFMHILNDLCFIEADSLGLRDWRSDPSSATSVEAVSEALHSLGEEPVAEFIHQMGGALASYDWRSSKAASLKDEPELRQAKARFRGSTGYRELRLDLLRHLIHVGNRTGSVARLVADKLGYEL